MIAVTSTTEKFLSCKETLVETYTLSGGGVEFVIPATIDLFACVRNSVNTLKIEIVRQNDQQTSVNAKSVDQINAQLKLSSAIKFASAESVTILASRNIDVTKLFPNSATLSRTFAGARREDLASLLPSKTRILPSQSEVAVKSTTSSEKTDRVLAAQLRDPGSSTAGFLPLDTVAAISATSISERAVAVVPVGAAKTKIVLADPTRIDVKMKITYPGSIKDLTGCKIRVTVRARNVEAQVLTLRPSIASFLEVSDVPVLPPRVVGGTSELGRARIFVTQQDKLSDAVSVSARSVKDYTQPATGFSTVVESTKCAFGQTVAIDLSLSSASVVRVHPVRDDTISPVFGSVVIGKVRRGPERFSSATYSSLIAVNSPTGISLDLVTTEQQVEAALLRRFDIRSGTYTTLSTAPVLVSTVSGLIDDSVEDLAIVRYEIDLYKSNGDVIRKAAVSDIVTRMEPRDIVSAEITVEPIVVGNQVVKISIVPAVKQNDVNFLIEYIKGLGIETAFQTDLESLRKSLLNCVKFDVTRYDMQSGETKYVGETSGEIEDDIDDVKISSKFLYVFDAFVRSPSQLTDVISDRSSRPVGSSPKITKIGLHITKADIDKLGSQTVNSLSDARRFFSRSNFETGTMPSAPASDGFRDGRTGDIFLLRVTVAPVLPIVTAIEVKSVRNLPVILWKVSGNTRLIDRYVVTGTSSDATWTVAAAGSVGTSAALQVTDTLAHTFPRYVSYSVYPVYLDGRSGSAVTADAVLIDRTREV